MAEQKIMNRWLVVAGALVIQVSLGAVYIWSVFQTPLQAYFPAWTEAQVTLPAQILIGAFAVAVIFGGRIQDRLGPRLVATTGGIILGAGLILSGFTGGFGSGPALAWLIFTVAVLGGIGIGLAYVCPIATCVKWFPDKRGLITGLAVAGFGGGAFFIAPLAKALITGGAYELLGVRFFMLPELGVFSTLMTLGFIFLCTVVFGAQLLRNPPAGYVPAGWTPPRPAAGAAKKVDFTASEMLATPTFWALWITFFAGSTAGLQVIMKASPIWQSSQIAGLTPPILAADFARISVAGAMAVSVLAIFNSLGRILWGRISDSLGRKTTLVVMFVLCGSAMFALDLLHAFPAYLIGISIVGLCFGGYLALYPAITADFFGTRHLGINYGWVFSAYGMGGLVGPFLAAWLMRVVARVPYEAVQAGQVVEKTFVIGNYQAAFLVSGVACLLAALVVIVGVKPPVAPERVEVSDHSAARAGVPAEAGSSR